MKSRAPYRDRMMILIFAGSRPLHSKTRSQLLCESIFHCAITIFPPDILIETANFVSVAAFLPLELSINSC